MISFRSRKNEQRTLLNDERALNFIMVNEILNLPHFDEEEKGIGS